VVKSVTPPPPPPARSSDREDSGPPPTYREGLPVFDSDLINPIPTQREAILSLDSDPPSAKVFLDGNAVGQTPLSGVDVPFGRHVVRMEAPGREIVSTDVELRPEAPLRALTVTLPAASEGIPAGKLVAFSPSVTPPRRMSGSVPAYPDGARQQGLEGAPVVEAWIGETGEVINVALLESAGPSLDRALVEAVERWRFTPAKLGGVPVSVRLTIQHVFRR
jgi:protein TonB